MSTIWLSVAMAITKQGFHLLGEGFSGCFLGGFSGASIGLSKEAYNIGQTEIN